MKVNAKHSLRLQHSRGDQTDVRGLSRNPEKVRRKSDKKINKKLIINKEMLQRLNLLKSEDLKRRKYESLFTVNTS